MFIISREEPLRNYLLIHLGPTALLECCYLLTMIRLAFTICLPFMRPESSPHRDSNPGPQLDRWTSYQLRSLINKMLSSINKFAFCEIKASFLLPNYCFSAFGIATFCNEIA